MSRVLAWLLVAMLMIAASPVQAQTRAWLDRAQVGHGETGPHAHPQVAA